MNGTCRLALLATATICLFSTLAAPARSDTFELKTGNTIEGEILEDLGDSYRVRVAGGIIHIKKAEIVKHTTGLTTRQRYERKKRETPDTAEGHYGLSKWCKRNHLRDKELHHLRLAIERDEDYEPARFALGHVKIRGKWVDPRKQERAEAASQSAKSDEEAQQQDKLLRELIAKWHVRIQAIYRGKLEGKTNQPAVFGDGRKQILAIQDPLAIPALTGVLSRGGQSVRRVLIEALDQFNEDEATMNLLVIALLDPSAEIRRLAAIELVPRKDKRIVQRLIEGLGSEDEWMIRRSADTLGVLKARPAVDALIDVLSIETRKLVSVTRPVYFRRIHDTFGGVVTVRAGNRNLQYRPDSIGVLSPELMMGTETSREWHTVSIYRTEVQEALIAITGQNFGFDADGWKQWWNHQEK